MSEVQEHKKAGEQDRCDRLELQGQIRRFREAVQTEDTSLLISPCSSRRSREQFSVSCPSHLSLPPNSDSSESGMLSRLGDLLFYTVAEGQERIPIHKFTTVSSSPPARDTLGSLETGRRQDRYKAANGRLHYEEEKQLMIADSLGCSRRSNSTL